jgi:hypothetical protein
MASCSVVSRLAGTTFDDIWDGCNAPITIFTREIFLRRAVPYSKRIEGAWGSVWGRRVVGRVEMRDESIKSREVEECVWSSPINIKCKAATSAIRRKSMEACHTYSHYCPSHHAAHCASAHILGIP